eukprot:3049369-Rhodomonas_salina.1
MVLPASATGTRPSPSSYARSPAPEIFASTTCARNAFDCAVAAPCLGVFEPPEQSQTRFDAVWGVCWGQRVCLYAVCCTELENGAMPHADLSWRLLVAAAQPDAFVSGEFARRQQERQLPCRFAVPTHLISTLIARGTREQGFDSA